MQRDEFPGVKWVKVGWIIGGSRDPKSYTNRQVPNLPQGSPVPRCQDLPSAAFGDRSLASRAFAVTHPWLAFDHPDPDGLQLQSVRSALEALLSGSVDPGALNGPVTSQGFLDGSSIQIADFQGAEFSREGGGLEGTYKLKDSTKIRRGDFTDKVGSENSNLPTQEQFEKDFDKNLFCHEFTNTGCWTGFSDCRMSAALFNWKIASNNYVWATTFGRAVGYVFNQTLVETSMGKCMYVFDGASENRLNNGCALGGGADCSKPGSAYADICPSTGKICTADDIEVTGQMCKPDGPIPPPIKSDVGNQCFFSMPALNYPKMDRPNHLQIAVAARVADELKTGNYADHNELVIDERVLIPEICNDPAVTIPAFVFAKSREADGRKAAEAMRDKFSRDYKVGKIPIIGVNDVSSFEPNGPFFVPEDIVESEMVI